jgi:tetratricopeptide (TPR) repeat protein
MLTSESGDRGKTRVRQRLAGVCTLLFGLALALDANAGGSPETTLVVVNADSPLSARIANEYVRLRDIPDTHLVWISGVGSMGRLSITDFRKKIWQPIREHVREHALEEEIDLIAYSSDFPYAVTFSEDVHERRLQQHPLQGDAASLTGLTYFASRVEAGDPGYVAVNHYFREFAEPRRERSTEAGKVVPLSDQEAEALLREAESALIRKDYEAAEGRYRRLLASKPLATEPWYGLARCLAARGDAAAALEALASAVDRGWTQSLRTQRDAELANLRTERGFRRLVERMSAHGPFEIAHGFRHGYVWSSSDLAMWQPRDALDQYYLSTMLAYTGFRGNSFPEVVDYLRRGAASDGTYPDGTVYLMENENVRSETRQPLFPATVRELAKRGRKGEILTKGRDGQDGIVPVGRDDVVGVVLGASDLDWGKSNSRLLPGAVAESLTSYGGDFDYPNQTKLSALLRHGAAGSSGAATEPFALQQKFPVPLLHAYYADGCSLAEAFYQSILQPYQLLIVGDPLARPFARFANVALEAPDVERPWSGAVHVRAIVSPAGGTSVRTIELWVDGQHVASGAVGEPIPWDTRGVEDGSHELRLVAVEDSVIETRSVFHGTVNVFNRDHRVVVDEATRDVEYGRPIAVAGQARGAARVELRRGHQVLGATEVKEGRWSLVASSTDIGMGVVPVIVRAVYPDGHAVRSESVEITVREPARLPAATLEQPAARGLRAVVEDKEASTTEVIVEQLAGTIYEVEKAGVNPERTRLSGYFHVAQDGTYQLATRRNGPMRIVVDDRLLIDDKVSSDAVERFTVVGLEAGWHPIDIELRTAGRNPFLKVVLGGDQVPAVLGKDALAHR